MQCYVWWVFMHLWVTPSHFKHYAYLYSMVSKAESTGKTTNHGLETQNRTNAPLWAVTQICKLWCWEKPSPIISNLFIYYSTIIAIWSWFQHWFFPTLVAFWSWTGRCFFDSWRIIYRSHYTLPFCDLPRKASETGAHRTVGKLAIILSNKKHDISYNNYSNLPVNDTYCPYRPNILSPGGTLKTYPSRLKCSCSYNSYAWKG